MIYHFTGNSDYLINAELMKWKNHFIEKHGEFNLIHIKNIGEYNNNILAEYLTSQSFGNQKKLILIDIGDIGKDSISEEKQEFVLSQLDKIPENNILVFLSYSPDKRTKFYKDINKIAEIKDFQIQDNHDIQKFLSKKYSNTLSQSAIETIILYKGGNVNKIISELDKLFITHTYIDKKDISEYIEPELEESIFQIINDIGELDIPSAIKKIDTILNNTNIYAFYNNLLANLRSQVYISKLKKLGVSTHSITTELNLGKRGFLVTKSYKISHSQLEKMYIKLIDLDKKMKTGKMIGNEEGDFKFEMEGILIGI